MELELSCTEVTKMLYAVFIAPSESVWDATVGLAPNDDVRYVYV